MANNLLHNFYTETSSDFKSDLNSNFSVNIQLNAEHPIYKGHFEQIPITPGVCQVQIIKEILMDKFKVKLKLIESDSIKYLGMINPETNANLSVKLNVTQTAEEMSVNATIGFETTIFTKFKGKFKVL